MTTTALEAAGRPAPKRGKAKPCKLTPDITATTVAAIRTGASLSEAARRAGVSHGTLMCWLARAEGRDEPAPATTMLAFARAVRFAQACHAADVFERADHALFIRTGASLMKHSPVAPATLPMDGLTLSKAIGTAGQPVQVTPRNEPTGEARYYMQSAPAASKLSTLEGLEIPPGPPPLDPAVRAVWEAKRRAATAILMAGLTPLASTRSRRATSR